MAFSLGAHFSLTMFATSPSSYFGIVGLLFANQVSSSCVTEDNQSKGMKETSCVRLALTSVPMKEIPQDTGNLILSFNNLKAISTSTFKGMKQLVELDLSDNALTSFKVDLPVMLRELNLANNSFKSIPDLSQLSSLTRLVLSNNDISTIPDSAFKGLNSLKVLELQKNTINSLSEEVFKDLKSLDHLDLSYNQLWELPTHLIINLVHLEKFYLTENKLTNIPDNFFDGLNALAYVYLDKNPWNCNCALHYFKEWVEENGHNIYYLSDGTPVNEEKSVLCSDGIPLSEYNMDACNGKDIGDADQYTMPPKKNMPVIKVTKAQSTTAKTTKPWITTMKTTTVSLAKTTPVLTTEGHPTSVATTTKSRRMTTPIVTTPIETTPIVTTPIVTTPIVTTPIVTTPIVTTPIVTTPIVTTPIVTAPIETTPIVTTPIVTTPIVTTPILTSTKQPEATPPWTTRKMTTKTYNITIMATTEQIRTTPQTTEVPTSIISSTTTLHPTSTLPTTMKVKPSSLTTTSIVSTQKHLTEKLMMSTDKLLYTMPPAENSRAEAHGMSWLEYKILKNCCFLHLIIYILGIFLLIAQMILSACLLVWTHTHLYRHYQALMEKLPNIRLIRYSLRAPVSEGTILLVHDKAIESNFSDQSFSGVTRMLVLEANTRNQERIYTSAIL